MYVSVQKHISQIKITRIIRNWLIVDISSSVDFTRNKSKTFTLFASCLKRRQNSRVLVQFSRRAELNRTLLSEDNSSILGETWLVQRNEETKPLVNYQDAVQFRMSSRFTLGRVLAFPSSSFAIHFPRCRHKSRNMVAATLPTSTIPHATQLNSTNESFPIRLCIHFVSC